MSCSICSLGLQGSDTRELHCKHKFHTNYINESVKYNTMCPYCRKEYPLIEHYSKNMNKEIKYGVKRRRSILVNIDNEDYIVVGLDNYRESVVPKCWINTLEQYIVMPLHILTINGVDYLMTLYLRLVLLFSGENSIISIIKKKDIMDTEYLDTDNTLYFSNSNYRLEKKAFLICYDWIFDVLHEIKIDFKLTYASFINTLLFDFTLEYIKNVPTLKGDYQGVLVAGMYVISEMVNREKLDKFKCKRLLERLLYYSDGATSIESINKYTKYMYEYMDSYKITRVK